MRKIYQFLLNLVYQNNKHFMLKYKFHMAIKILQIKKFKNIFNKKGTKKKNQTQ